MEWNWVEKNEVKRKNWIQWNEIERNWMKLSGIEWKRMELNGIERNWMDYLRIFCNNLKIYHYLTSWKILFLKEAVF